MNSEYQALSNEAVENFRDPQWGAEQLQKIIIFKSFDSNTLREVYKLGAIEAIPRASHAVIEGEPSRGIYLILHGTLSVLKSDQTTGNTHRLASLEAGDSFGELSLFDQAPRSATVVADILSYVFHLEAEVFETFLQDSGDKLSAKFYKTCAISMSERFRSLNSDYITSQQLLWKYALRKEDKDKGAS